MSLLSSTAIRRHLLVGSIVIEPFQITRLNTNSYDLELGSWFWRHAPMGALIPSDGQFGFVKVDAILEHGIWLVPGERVLGHTREVAGGRVAGGHAVTSHLHATSTAGRHGLSVCQCAGFGDVGYCSRWTLEIQNHTTSRFWLPVGAIVCQLAFEEVEIPDKEYVAHGGRYQVENWTPEAMLPGPLKVAAHG